MYQQLIITITIIIIIAAIIEKNSILWAYTVYVSIPQS
jgi:hypothetical protein